MGFTESKDGVKIPMFVVSPKNLPKDSSRVALLYGYGGFNISMTPYFSASRMAFLLGYGGSFALANLRGGGEYGEEWWFINRRVFESTPRFVWMRFSPRWCYGYVKIP